METLGQRIAKYRKEKGLTQDELASKLNISPQAVSKWENDITSPDISTLPVLADIFDISIDELLGRAKEKVEYLGETKRKDINKMFLKINVNDGGDKVKINIPLAIIKVCLDTGLQIPQITGNKSLSSIDFREVYKMIEQGVIGEVVSVECEDGTTVSIIVE